MAANDTLGLNIEFPIYNADGTSFQGLVLKKSTYDSIVMSLGDKVTGDVYYKDNTLAVSMQEYIVLDGVKYVLVTPPTVVRDGMVSDNGQLNGMTKYSFVFYHPMYMLGNFPFADVAVSSSETKYLSESKKFTWVGYPDDFIAKINKNLDGTEWIVEKSNRFPAYLDEQLSNVLPFDGNTIADACKTFYETWGAPYVVAKVESTETAYASGKRFKVVFGLPSNEIYADVAHEQLGEPFVFQFGKGVGLKNNSRTPRNNKIVTRIAGYGSEDNIPYGYPQIPWYGDSRWDYTEYEGDTIVYDADGHVTNTPKSTAYPLYMGIVGGAYIKLIQHPFTRKNLMPSIYGQTLFNKVSPYLSDGTANPNYNPNTTLIDYYDAIATQEYPYPNPIVANAPSYESHEFEDVKPELGQNIAIVDAYPVNKDLTPAPSWDDSIDDDGNYVQSYFKMQLPVLSFDIYACAAITQEMKINMRSGACLGCTFTVQVDWDDYKANFYDSDGNFAPTGSQRDYTKYPDSSQEQITVVLQKDTATFGTIMPNVYQYPVADDTFVVLGISLPLSYITNAETRLDAEMKSYMLENNVHYFDYPLKFDEAFLRNHTYILSQIKPNAVIRFKYGNDILQLFVKQLTVKYGDNPLPQYDITLTDNVEVVLNQIGRVAEDVEKLGAIIAAVRQNYNRSVWAELEKKLSKTQDDTAAGYIRMLKGLQVGSQFVPDILGEGGVFRMGADGKVELVTDRLYARVSAYFDNVEIRDYRHSGGNRIASQAQGFTCSRVEWIKVVSGNETILEQNQENLSDVDFFRCYWRVDDGEKKTDNQFIIGDLAFCESANVDDDTLTTKRFWRVVVGRNSGNTTTADGEAWVDLSNAHNANGTPKMTTITYQGQGGVTQTMQVLSFETGSGIPEPKDDICQLGDVRDTTRQGAIIEYVTGVDAPSYQIFQGIGEDATNPYSLTNKNQITIGYNSATGHADLKVYGDAYIGDPNGSTFIEYKQDDGTEAHAPVLNIKARINASSTIGGQSLPDYIKNNQNNYNDAWVHSAVEDLQSQIDGEIDSYFYNYLPVANLDSKVPLTSVEPYKTWYETDGGGTASEVTTERTKHLADTFYDNSSGYAFRFTLNENTSAFEWTLITDSAVVQALANAAKAQETADGKRTVYSVWNAWVKNGVNTLKQGDLFIPASTTTQGGTTYKAKKVYKCTTDGSATFEEIEYTDDSALHSYIGQILNKTYASGDDVVAAAAQRAIQGALNGGTLVDGGLLLSSLIGMRKYNETTQTYTTWGGISGMFDSQAYGNGIAAWFGGAQADMETMTTAQKAAWDALTDQQKAASADWAKIVNRFDGSGYLASNNIKWTADGKVYLSNIHTASGQAIDNYFFEAFAIGIDGQTRYINPQFTFNHIDVVRRTGTGAVTLSGSSVLNRDEMDARYVKKDFFDAIFKPEDSNGNRITTNGSTTALDRLKILVGTYTDQYLSALGLGDDSGGGGATTLSALNDVAINNLSDGQMLVYDLASTHWVNRSISLVTSMSSLTDVVLTSLATNQILKFNGTNWVNADLPAAYTLPAATSGALGGIKIGYNGTTEKTYAVQLDSNNKAYVSVPWTDYNTWIAWVGATEENNGTAGYMPAPTIAQRNLFLRGDGTWVALNNYSLPTASSSTKGGVKVGSTLAIASEILNLASGIVTTGTYRSVTVDTYGRVTAGTNPTTIEGYGIIDAKIVNGVITLGANTITPLTSHQTLYTLSIYGGTTKVVSFKPNADASLYIKAGGDISLTNDTTNKYITLSYSHPTNGANTTITAANGKVLSAISVNNLGHVTSVSSKTLAATDIPDISETYATASRATTLEGYFTNGVANKAEKLNTSRNLWGQSFNGTANVSGNMTGVGNITMSSTNGTYIQLGDIRIVYDSANDALKIVKSDGTSAASLYATGGISALGQNVDGQAGTGDVTWALLADNTDTRQIALSHLTTSLTTITGGTTDSTNKKYAVYKNSSNQLFVDVPWQAGAGTVTSVKVGDTAYTPTAGVISLPAYPTSLPASDVYSWAKAATKPTYTASEVGAATSDHTHTTSIATSTANNQLTLAFGSKYAITAGGTSYVFTMPSNPNTNTTYKFTIGSTTNGDATNGVDLGTLKSETAASGGTTLSLVTTGEKYSWNNKTYTTSIATDSGTNQLTLAFGTKYKLTAGGTSYIFTMPANPNTDHYDWSDITNKPLTLTKNATGFSISGGSTTSKTLTVSESYTLGAACAKGVTDNSSNADVTSSDTNLITGRTLYYQLAKKGYTTNTGTVTSVATGTGLTGGTITSSGTISINSTYQTYISHGESAYGWGNHANAGYVTTAGSQTISGLKTFTAGLAVSGRVYGRGDDEGIVITRASTNYATICLGSASGIRSMITLTPNNKTYWRYNDGNSDYDIYHPAKNGTIALVSDLSSYVPLSGGTMTGILQVNAPIVGYNYSQQHGNAAAFVFDKSGSNWTGIGANGEADTIYFSACGSEGAWVHNYKQIWKFNGDIKADKVQIGSIELQYDSTNNAIKVVKSDGTAANLYATGGLSALGAGQESGGGGGDVTWALLASQATGGRTIHSSYISSTLSNYATVSSLGGYLKTTSANTSYDVNGIYNAGLYMCSGGSSNMPHGSQFGVVLCLPYRKAYGNTTTDFCAQIEIPNGDDLSYPNGMFYRTSIGSSWNAWQRVQNVSMSDVRLKTILSYPTFDIRQIANAPIIRYIWSKEGYGDKNVHVGSTAQYWMNVSREFVEEEFGGYYSLQYGVAALISAITVARKVMTHEEEIALLKTRVSALEKENGEQENLINSLQEELAKFKAA